MTQIERGPQSEGHQTANRTGWFAKIHGGWRVLHMSGIASRYVAGFEEVSLDDIGDVGGKNASLGEMIRELGGAGVRVSEGVATTAAAYRAFISENNFEPRIRALIESY